MKAINYIIFLFSLLQLSCNQKKVEEKQLELPIDSLEFFFSEANNFDLSISERQLLINKAFAIVNQQKNDSIYRVNLFKIANRYYNLDKFSEYKKTVFLILKKSEEQRDIYSVAKGNAYLGDYYLLKEQSDSAFFYYNRAENRYLQLDDRYSVSQALIKKATLQYKESDFLGAEMAVSKALKTIGDKGYNDILYDSFNLLGQIYNELEDYEKALEYHKKALASIDKNLSASFSQPKATSLNNIGIVHQNKKEFEIAKKYFEKGLLEKDVLKNKAPLYAILLNNLAYAKFKLKDKKDLPHLFFESLKIRDSLQLNTGIIGSKINISEYFLSEGDTVKALQFAKQALSLSKEVNNSPSILNSLKQLSVVDFKNKAVYATEYIALSEKRQKLDRAIGNKFSSIEFETAEIKEKNDALATNNKTLLYGLIALSTISLLLYLIKSQRNRNKILQYKQSQQAANEAIYNLMISQQNTIDEGRIKEKKRVAQELHDGVLGRMFGLRINLDSLNQFEDDNAVQKRTKYLLELQNIEQDIREISHDLNRENQTLINNFVVILNNLLEEQRKTFSIQVQSNISTTINWNAISNSVKINIYRIIQESLQNINKYANATTIIVRCLQNEKQLVLEIIDDGIGFNTIKAKKGIGLQNILFRANECKGEADFKSAKGQGTTIKVSIPLQSN